MGAAVDAGAPRAVATAGGEKGQPSSASMSKLIDRARKKMARFDKIDHGEHRAAPASQQLKTVYFALQAGITRKDWDYVAEAYVMLEQAVRL